jgi:3-hydroxyacyl-CoA dehydrogenase
MAVTRADRGAVAIVCLENPPMNVLSQSVRKGLVDLFRELAGDENICGVVLAGNSAVFSAGADISEFSSGLEGETPPLFHALHM